MKCPKCNRDNSDERKTCMYCGESLDSQAPSDKNTVVSDDSTTTVQKEKMKKTKVDAFPDTVEMNAKDIPHPDSIEEKTHEESRKTVVFSDDGEIVENRAEMSQDRALTLLNGFKESFDNDQLGAAEYEKLVLEVIKDYIMPMDDKEKINFVANGIKDSEFYDFLNEDAYQQLRSFVVEYVAGK